MCLKILFSIVFVKIQWQVTKVFFVVKHVQKIGLFPTLQNTNFQKLYIQTYEKMWHNYTLSFSPTRLLPLIRH